MQTKLLFIALLCCINTSLFAQIDTKKQFDLAAQQYEGMLASHSDLIQFPRSSWPDAFLSNL